MADAPSGYIPAGRLTAPENRGNETGMDVLFSILIIGTFVLNIGLFGTMVYLVLRMKKDLVDDTIARVRPMIAKGKVIADSGRREIEENKDRLEAFVAAFKGLITSVRPTGENVGPRTQFGYRHLLTLLSVLGSLRRGLRDMGRTRAALAHPPEPPKGKRKAPPRRLGTLEMIPSVIRLAREVRRALR